MKKSELDLNAKPFTINGGKKDFPDRVINRQYHTLFGDLKFLHPSPVMGRFRRDGGVCIIKCVAWADFGARKWCALVIWRNVKVVQWMTKGM